MEEFDDETNSYRVVRVIDNYVYVLGNFIIKSQINLQEVYEEIKEILTGALKKHFRPEFINRIDVVTVFHPLNTSQLSQIAKLFITGLNKRLQSRGASLKITESALKYLIHKGYDSEYGARPLRRLIEQEIEDRLAEQLLDGSISANSTIIISARDGKLNFKIADREN